MMARCRHTLFGILLLAATPAAQALTVGAPAPPLDVGHWLKGDAITAFAPDSIHVVEFWATWCGPCIANMDHLSELQERYADAGVTVVGLSDEPLQKVVDFLCGSAGEGRIQNDRIRYTLGTDPDGSVRADYREAAQTRGLPVAFVIGTDGHVEWLGHPSALDPVLAAVVAGTWDRRAHRAEIAAQQMANRQFKEATAALRAAMAAQAWEDAITALDEIITSSPEHDTYVPTKLGILLSHIGDLERAYREVRAVAASVWDDNPWLLYQIAWVVSGDSKYPVPDADRDLELALRCAARAAELEPETEYHHTMHAGILAQLGRHAEAAAAQRQAIAALEAVGPRVPPAQREAYERDLQQLRAELAEFVELGEKSAPAKGRSRG